MNIYLQGNDDIQVLLQPTVIPKLPLIQSFIEMSETVGTCIFPVELFSSTILDKMIHFLSNHSIINTCNIDEIAQILLALDFFQVEDHYLNLVVQYLGKTYREQFLLFRTHVEHLQPTEPGNPGK